MAQAQAQFMTPQEHVAIALQKAVSVAALATFYVVHLRSPSREDFHTLISDQASHPEDQVQGNGLHSCRGYYDQLVPEHKKLIRHMTVILHMGDLTVEAFDHIEDQLRAKDVARGRLPPDDSVEDWLAPVVYHLISIWRSKLAWLKEWTWLEDLEIHSGLCTRGFPNVLPKSMSVRIQGYYLPVYLEGIGPSEPRCPLVDCYKDCNNMFARQMRTQEEFLWSLFAWMIECFGWKATKAIIRRKVWEESTGRSNDGLV
ncbi:MAG: hypothetical protein Q9205_003898 [Flavoplaca limonia]